MSATEDADEAQRKPHVRTMGEVVLWVAARFLPDDPRGPFDDAIFRPEEPGRREGESSQQHPAIALPE